jgi:hypothetical protein
MRSPLTLDHHNNFDAVFGRHRGGGNTQAPEDVHTEREAENAERELYALLQLAKSTAPHFLGAAVVARHGEDSKQWPPRVTQALALHGLNDIELGRARTFGALTLRLLDTSDDEFEAIIGTLTNTEKQVLRMRYARPWFAGGTLKQWRSLDEITNTLGHTRERLRLIEYGALDKLLLIFNVCNPPST